MDILEFFKMVTVKFAPKDRKATHAIIGKSEVAHIYGGSIRKARKLIEQYNGNLDMAMAAHPELASAKVKRVPVTFVRPIDRSKKWKK